VSCPFGYPDTASAVRGLLSTGLFDAADPSSVSASDEKSGIDRMSSMSSMVPSMKDDKAG